MGEIGDDLAFYRIVRAAAPDQSDFASHQSLGKIVLNPTPEKLRHAQGVSVFRTEDLARRKALRFPGLGRYIAELRVSRDGPIRWERTGGRGHFTLWAEPDRLLAAVVAVAEV